MNRFYFNVIDSNLLACMIILLIISNLKISNRSESHSSRSMMALCWSILVVLIVDALAWSFMGVTGRAGYYLVYGFNFLLFFLNPLPPTLWLLYIMTNFREGEATRNELRLLSLPMIVNSLVMIANFFTGFIFTVDAVNQYHRGPGLLVVALIDYSAIIAAVLLAVNFRDRIKKRVMVTVIIFSILPLAGSLIQIFFYGISTSWPSMAIGVLMTYIFIEVQQNIRDHLTGLLNRRKIEDIVSHRITRYAPDKPFTLMVLDMNDFKSINDEYGHSEGDRALQEASLIISRSVQAGDVVARVGGDEFVILLDTDSRSIIDGVIRRIQDGIDRWNAHDNAGFKLSLSLGAVVFDPARHVRYKDFFREADKMMYLDKRKKKGLPSR